MVDLNPILDLIQTFFGTFLGVICIMGLAIFAALVGWGLEILRRREATIVILMGMVVSIGLIVIALNSSQISQTYTNAIKRFEPTPTVMATSIPIPTMTPTPKHLNSTR